MKQCPNCHETMSCVAESRSFPNDQVAVFKTYQCMKCKTYMYETNIIELMEATIQDMIKTNTINYGGKIDPKGFDRFKE